MKKSLRKPPNVSGGNFLPTTPHSCTARIASGLKNVINMSNSVLASELDSYYTKIPNSIARGGCHPAYVGILTTILSYGSECWASVTTIGKAAGCDEKTVRRALQYWKKFSELNPWFLWEQTRSPKSTYNILVTFVEEIMPHPKGSGRVTAGITQVDIGRLGTTSRAQDPTIKKMEKENLITEKLRSSDGTDTTFDKPKEVPTLETIQSNNEEGRRQHRTHRPTGIRLSSFAEGRRVVPSREEIITKLNALIAGCKKCNGTTYAYGPDGTTYPCDCLLAAKEKLELPPDWK